MCGLTRRLAGWLSYGLVLSASLPATAQEQALSARATARALNEPLVRTIAKYAQPAKLTYGPGLNAGAQTADQAIRTRCGVVHPGYYDEFLSLNRPLITKAGLATLDPNVPLGPLADTLSWPACIPLRLKPGTNAVSNTLPTLAEAPPVELRPVDGMTTAQLAAALKAVVVNKQTDVDDIVWQPASPPPAGNIVAAVETPDPFTGKIQPPPCTSVRAFDADAVGRAYNHSRSQSKALKKHRDPVTAWVFDNGFYGVNPTADPAYAPSFPEAFFVSWGPGRVGPTITLDKDNTVTPLNYDYRPPSSLSSHGTHVTGMVLGGAEFLSHRDVFLDPDDSSKPWLRLGVINLARGGRTLIEGSEDKLLTLIRDKTPENLGRIVNLSLAYVAPEGVDFSDRFAMLTVDQRDLFVAAAGNESDDPGVMRAYPAAMGGSDGRNVITVAAHDDEAPAQLTGFSNRGENVDIAAPGCALLSWTDMTNQERMSGTSQAAPLVSFTAILIRSLDSALTGADIKQRILASADLLALKDEDELPRLKLNIPTALFVFDDYLRLANGEEYIGTADLISGLRCKTDLGKSAFGRPTDDIVSYNAGPGEAQLMVVTPKRSVPCKAAIGSPGYGMKTYIKFRPTQRIDGGSLVPADGKLRQIDLTNVSKYVRRARPAAFY